MGMGYHDVRLEEILYVLRSLSFKARSLPVEKVRTAYVLCPRRADLAAMRMKATMMSLIQDL